ncbi:MAG TPA: ATP-binding cassette domain-containing protein [Chthonomonadales bacterium]|nr:ATP-binding cassette domain-containing protein [Chthonomonadales bacterium]
MENSIVLVEDLVKQYGDTTAVDGISFQVPEGGFFGFLGPNGAGKTTTMRILATLLHKTSGTALVAGHDVEREPNLVRKEIGFAMQDISLDNLASGYENLQLLGVLYGLSPKQSRARAEELLEMVGLSKVASRWVNSYSGGMRRRLDLAGTLMHRPRLLFLDEPTQGLDPQARRSIWDYLQKLNREGSTIFLTTHYMDEADVLCKDLAFIDRGKIVKRGAPSELKASMGGDVITLSFPDEQILEDVEETVRSAVGDGGVVTAADGQITVTSRDAGGLAPKLISTLTDRGAPPASLTISQPSLEDLFVRLVGRSIMDDETQLVTGRDPFVEARR